MSADAMAAPSGSAPLARLENLVVEAGRQLTICNSCRYCEGYCAVFPALERRSVLDLGDVAQLANLCHDCRACFDACMYSAPHEFAVNVPQILTSARLQSYDCYVWPTRVPRLLRGWWGTVAGALLSAAVVVGSVCIVRGPEALWRTPHGTFSPYDVTPYPLLLVLCLLPFVFAVAVAFFAGRSYWRDIGGAPPTRDRRALVRAVGDVLTLRFQRGAGADCYYPEDDRPSPSRRRFHQLTMYGFGLCVVSTVSAATLQDFIGSEPPYPVLSVPVITGTAGGIGLVIGCLGLLQLKARSSAVTSVSAMTVKDYGLLVALLFLALSGLAVLLVRDMAAFPLVFVVHLSAVVLAIGSAPYSKFVHLVFRFQALVRDEMEVGPGGR